MARFIILSFVLLAGVHQIRATGYSLSEVTSKVEAAIKVARTIHDNFEAYPSEKELILVVLHKITEHLNSRTPHDRNQLFVIGDTADAITALLETANLENGLLFSISQCRSVVNILLMNITGKSSDSNVVLELLSSAMHCLDYWPPGHEEFGIALITPAKDLVKAAVRVLHKIIATNTAQVRVWKTFEHELKLLEIRLIGVKMPETDGLYNHFREQIDGISREMENLFERINKEDMAEFLLMTNK